MGYDIRLHSFDIAFFAVVHIAPARLINARYGHEHRIVLLLLGYLGIVARVRLDGADIVRHVLMRHVAPITEVIRARAARALDERVLPEVVQERRVHRKPVGRRYNAVIDAVERPRRACIAVPTGKTRAAVRTQTAVRRYIGKQAVRYECERVVGNLAFIADAPAALEVVVIFVEVAPCARGHERLIVERRRHPAHRTVDRPSPGESDRRACRNKRLVEKHYALIGDARRHY